LRSYIQRPWYSRRATLSVYQEKVEIRQQVIYLGEQTTNAVAGYERRSANACIAVLDIVLITRPVTRILGIASAMGVLRKCTHSCVRRRIDLQVGYVEDVRYKEHKRTYNGAYAAANDSGPQEMNEGLNLAVGGEVDVKILSRDE
jgi:hypothetical protein